MIPNAQRVIRQDMPGSQDWIDPFLSKYNSKVDDDNSLYNGGITFDNLRGSLVKTTFSTPSNYSSGVNVNFTPFTFPISFKGASIVVIGSVDVNSSNYLVSNQPLTIPVGGWRESGAGKITIYYMTGLQPSTSYIAFFQVF
jgi:hypothetical protein